MTIAYQVVQIYTAEGGLLGFVLYFFKQLGRLSEPSPQEQE